MEMVGEQDVSTAAQFRAALDSVFESVTVSQAEPTLVVIDLSKSRLVDSSIIAAILRVYSHTRDDPDAGLAVVVASPESFTAIALRLVGFTRIVPTYTSRADAVASLSRRETESGL